MKQSKEVRRDREEGGRERERVRHDKRGRRGQRRRSRTREEVRLTNMQHLAEK